MQEVADGSQSCCKFVSNAKSLRLALPFCFFLESTVMRFQGGGGWVTLIIDNRPSRTSLEEAVVLALFVFQFVHGISQVGYMLKHLHKIAGRKHEGPEKLFVCGGVVSFGNLASTKACLLEMLLLRSLKQRLSEGLWTSKRMGYRASFLFFAGGAAQCLFRRVCCSR